MTDSPDSTDLPTPLKRSLREILERTMAEAASDPSEFRRALHDDADEHVYDSAALLRERRLAELELPPLYADVSLDTFEPHGATDAERNTVLKAHRAAKKIAERWPDAPAISVFFGGFGTGKTHCAYAIARYVVEHRQATARVVVLSDAIRDLRDAWASREPGGLSESARLARYREPDLLVIDEVSRHAFYGQPTQHLYDIVAWRELRRRPTILTTNERGDDLAAVLGNAVMSRAIQHRSIVDFGEHDYRRVIAENATSAAADERATRRIA